MKLEDYFPETIFTQEWVKKFGLRKAMAKQLAVITGEVIEVQDSFSRNQQENAMEELIDVMQAAYTAMRMIPGYSPEAVENVLVKRVYEKNKNRGYLIQ